MRKNGFEPPFEVQQVITWIVFISISVEFYVLLLPVHEADISLWIGVTYGITELFSAFFSFLACKIDPIDPQLENQINGVQASGNRRNRANYCYICRCDVCQGSKHCHFCGKCVHRFDHHCRWLNNCIGKKNYRYFLVMLISTLLLISMQLTVSVRLIVLYHIQNETEQDSLRYKVEECFGELSSEGFISIVYIFSIVLFPLVCLLLQLIGFHILLATRGLTTYQYIVQQQKRENERSSSKTGSVRVSEEQVVSPPNLEFSSRESLPREGMTAPASTQVGRRSNLVNLSAQAESMASLHMKNHRKHSSDVEAVTSSID